MKKSLAILLCLSVAPSALFAKTAMEEIEFLTKRLQQALALKDPGNTKIFGEAILELITQGTTVEAANAKPAYDKQSLGLIGGQYGFSKVPATQKQAAEIYAALDLAAFASKKVGGLKHLIAPVKSQTDVEKHKSAAITYYTNHAKPVTNLEALVNATTKGTQFDGTPIPHASSPYVGVIHIQNLLELEKMTMPINQAFGWVTGYYYPEGENLASVQKKLADLKVLNSSVKVSPPIEKPKGEAKPSTIVPAKPSVVTPGKPFTPNPLKVEPTGKPSTVAFNPPPKGEAKPSVVTPVILVTPNPLKVEPTGKPSTVAFNPPPKVDPVVIPGGKPPADLGKPNVLGEPIVHAATAFPKVSEFSNIISDIESLQKDPVKSQEFQEFMRSIFRKIIFPNDESSFVGKLYAKASTALLGTFQKSVDVPDDYIRTLQAGLALLVVIKDVPQKDISAANKFYNDLLNSYPVFKQLSAGFKPSLGSLLSAETVYTIYMAIPESKLYQRNEWIKLQGLYKDSASRAVIDFLLESEGSSYQLLAASVGPKIAIQEALNPITTRVLDILNQNMDGTPGKQYISTLHQELGEENGTLVKFTAFLKEIKKVAGISRHSDMLLQILKIVNANIPSGTSIQANTIKNVINEIFTNPSLPEYIENLNKALELEKAKGLEKEKAKDSAQKLEEQITRELKPILNLLKGDDSKLSYKLIESSLTDNNIIGALLHMKDSFDPKNPKDLQLLRAFAAINIPDIQKHFKVKFGEVETFIQKTKEAEEHAKAEQEEKIKKAKLMVQTKKALEPIIAALNTALGTVVSMAPEDATVSNQAKMWAESVERTLRMEGDPMLIFENALNQIKNSYNMTYINRSKISLDSTLELLNTLKKATLSGPEDIRKVVNKVFNNDLVNYIAGLEKFRVALKNT